MSESKIDITWIKDKDGDYYFETSFFAGQIYKYGNGVDWVLRFIQNHENDTVELSRGHIIPSNEDYERLVSRAKAIIQCNLLNYCNDLLINPAQQELSELKRKVEDFEGFLFASSAFALRDKFTELFGAEKEGV